MKKAVVMAGSAKQPFVRNQFKFLQAQDDRAYTSMITGITNNFSFGEFGDVSGFVREPENSNKGQIALRPDTDIYLNIQTNILTNFAPMVRLLLASFLTAAQLTEQPGNPSCRRLFMLDEAKGLGKMDLLETIRDEGRDIGLHLMLIYQSFGKMMDVWDENASSAWLDSTETRIFGAMQDRRRAKDLSTRLGKDTIAIETQTESNSSAKYQAFSGQIEEGAHEQLKEIPFLSESDLAGLPGHGSIVMTRKMRPILASKVIYFTRNDMKRKGKSAREVQDEINHQRDRERQHVIDEENGVNVS